MEMLNKNRVYYSLRMREGSRSIQLLEHVDSVSGLFSKSIALIFPWRAEMIEKFVERISHAEDAEEKDGKKKKSFVYQKSLNSEEIVAGEVGLKMEDAMRILVAMKLASSIRERVRIEEALEVLYALSDEEISFWSWKILTYKNKGTSAFKAMYLRR
jgi:hypothetical protein